MRSAPGFHLVDAFAARPFAGEPLVVLDDERLQAEELARFASEFGGTPVVVLEAPHDPVNSARLRLLSGETARFRPAPVVAAATLLAQTRADEILRREGVVVCLELGESVFRCEVIRNRLGVCYAEFVLAPARARDGSPDVASLAAGLRLSQDEIGFEGHAPRSFGPPETLVAPVATREALRRAAPTPDFAELLGEDAEVWLYARADAAAEIAVEARLLCARGRRPASGEALAAFAAAAAEFERPEDGDHEIFVDLLDEWDRRARVTLRFAVTDGVLEETRLGGQAAIVAAGELTR